MWTNASRIFNMNRAIFTLMIGQGSEITGNISIPRMEDYAKKVNARFVVIKKNLPPFDFIPMSKFFLQRHLQNYSEGIFYLDIDTLINRNAPDIFDLTPKQGISAVWDSKNDQPNPEWNKYIKAAAALTEIEPWQGYFNNGVFLIRKNSEKIFNNPEYSKLMPWYPDQTIMNLNRARFNINYHNLGSEWNLMGQNGGNEQTWSKCNVAHFAGIELQTRIQLMQYINQQMP